MYLKNGFIYSDIHNFYSIPFADLGTPIPNNYQLSSSLNYIIIQMVLLKDIKQKREQQRRKQPFSRNVFNQISSIVRQYGLNERFLDVLDNVENYLPEVNLKFTRVRVKTPMESHLFFLANREEYNLTMSIISKIDKSYLKFAHSPEEILLCGPLYSLNPSISSEKLKRYHFATLLLHERNSRGLS